MGRATVAVLSPAARRAEARRVGDRPIAITAEARRVRARPAEARRVRVRPAARRAEARGCCQEPCRQCQTSLYLLTLTLILTLA